MIWLLAFAVAYAVAGAVVIVVDRLDPPPLRLGYRAWSAAAWLVVTADLTAERLLHRGGAR